MTKKNAKPHINRGISLLSMSIVLAIVLLAAPIGMQRYASFLEEQGWTVTATHLSTVNQAARKYVKDNYDTLLNQVKGGGNVTITGQTLRDKGYLPAGFALTNNSTQNYILAVTRNPTQTDKLVAFVLTAGGQEMTFKAQRYIAQSTTGLGGYIYPANIANGAGGGWQINLSSMGLSGQTGHLVTYLTSDVLAGGAEESDRLYRFAVNGRPDLNRMHTGIDMNNNDLNNAKAVNGETGNFSNTVTAQGDVKSQNGWLITRSGKGWLNEEHGGGLYMSDNDWIRSVNNKGIYTGGQMQAGTVQSNGRMTAGEFVQINGVATAGWGCSPNGLIGRNANGAILSCKDGIWTTSEKLRDFQTVSGAPACGKYNYSNAYCPAGKQLLSGGYVLSRWGGDGWNTPDVNMPTPDAKGWQIYTGGGTAGGSCITAVAVCATN
ncbi:TPA: shufflon system plasmid conjugative transfer pilus tip adhesin PilV [Klebsiella pneumoniae]|uniref:shufflon system plasmid conjugative transfer pilus tip adhesin PilV n=1 Tax=Klebsiella pneumoniae TaxID=573 RepID=UPI0024A86C80|nr:shufflon system plasmid conjugative transfer pilus tip adhesin PilV [Klebsiella pneumoniae]HDO7154532.1 shufflon system plasmid conjugative transfer pilus tip adhesin PilV [Klebsiella pneumoniae]